MHFFSEGNFLFFLSIVNVWVNPAGRNIYNGIVEIKKIMLLWIDVTECL